MSEKMLSKLLEGKTDKGKRIWLGEQAAAEAFLFKPARMLVIGTGVAICGMVLANFLLIAVRLTPWAGAWPGGAIEITELLMAIGGVMAVAHTWYIGAHLRIGLVREHSRPRAGTILDALSALLFLIWFACIVWALWGLSIDSLARGGQTTEFGIPEAPFIFFFCIICGHFVLVLLRSFLGKSIKAARRDVQGEDVF